MSIDVTLTLCSPAGEVFGDLEPITIGSSHLQDVGRVVPAAERVVKQRVVVLRLLDVQPDATGSPREVRYLAEVAERPSGLVSSHLTLLDHRHRMPWARPGGPDEHLAWARTALKDVGVAMTGRPRQARSWSLSSLWQLPTDAGLVWLKAVPPFFEHEGRVIRALQPFSVPRIVASATGIAMYRHVAGEDGYRARGPQLRDMLRTLRGIQLSFTAEAVLDQLGTVPDWRPQKLAERASETLAARGDELTAEERRIVDRYLSRWERTQSSLESCGVPYTLVHGDFHPGNVRMNGSTTSIMDWADSGIGHPMIDEATCTERLPSHEREAVLADSERDWRMAIPGVDVPRSRSVLGPLAALRRAALYQGFLANIEPDEHVYHIADPVRWLRSAAERLDRARCD